MVNQLGQGAQAMKKLLFAFTAATLFSTASAFAADIAAPPLYDWTGFYVGAFGGGAWSNNNYDYTCTCGTSHSNVSLDGSGLRGGIMAGADYQVDSFVFGIEGDFDFGGRIAKNNDPAEDTYFDASNIGSVRGRVGYAVDNALFYGTGGVAFVNTEFGSNSGFVDHDNAWLTGWVAGAGVEYAFSEAFSARLEYLYYGLPNHDYTLGNGVDTLNVKVNPGIQTVRVGVAWRF
jgi:outer membrane immunogenic protein